MKPPAEGEGEKPSDADGWSWCPMWRRYIHCATKTMWDPARAVYSRWDDAGNVVDYPGEEHARTGEDPGTMAPHHRAGAGALGADSGAEPAGCEFGQHVESEEEEYAAECRSTDDGSSDGVPADDGDLDARFIEYYKRKQAAETEGAGDDADGTHDSGGAIVSGDWVWDGEFWNTADGVSYHPGLNQYFSHGQRIFPSDEDKPKLCDEKLLETFQQKKYQDEYGTWASERREGSTAATHGGWGEAESQGTGAERKRGNGENAQGVGSTGQTRRGRTHVLGHNSSIGRSKSCALFIPRSALSRQHAKLEWEEKRKSFVLRNCSRRMRTFHNGKSVDETGALLSQGDVIFLGSSSSMSVVAVHAGGADTEPSITLRHSERGPSCVGDKASRSSAARSKEHRLPDHVHLDGEPLDGEVAGEGGEAGTYRDRAAERRSLHADAEAARRCEAYRSRQHQLQHRQAAREEKARRVQDLEATLAAIDAGCFRMPLPLPSMEPGGALAAAYPANTHTHTHPPPDPEWKERGAKMLKMMGWSEGQGLGRQKDGITAPIETGVQSGKSGLGLAAELSDKAAERLVEKLRVGHGETTGAKDHEPKSGHVHGL